MTRYILGLLFFIGMSILPASATDVVCNNDGRCIVKAGGERMTLRSHRGKHRANGGASIIHHGGATVRSKSGVTVRVNPAAQSALQCVVDYIERSGIPVKYMRGYGAGTVSASLHPSGNALDINQYARGRTRPHIPVSVANSAGDACGVVSGGRWTNNDAGHWNVGTYAGRHRHHRKIRMSRR